MTGIPGERIVWGWTHDALGMPVFRVQPADYPELESEGRTPDEACDRLIGLLDRSIDSSDEVWKKRPLVQARAEVRSFALEVRGFRRIVLPVDGCGEARTTPPRPTDRGAARRRQRPT
jgi:hypothetical protein